MWKSVWIFLGVVAVTVTSKGCEEDGLFPGSNPQSFIVCRNGVESEFQCGEQTVYSPWEKSCVPTNRGISAFLLRTLNSETNVDDTFNATCSKPGVMCRNCNELQVCIGTVEAGKSVVKPIVTVKCSGNQVCQFGKGCTNLDDGGFCSYSPFKCSDTGMYPDPYDCKKYHFCRLLGSQIKHITTTCTYGSFNVETLTCGHPLDTELCVNRPVPTCLEQFQMGPVGRSLFYVCVKNGNTLSPNLYSCPPGKQFNSSSYVCE